MAYVKKGSIREFYADGVAVQPDYSITEKNDGTLEGQITFVCDINDFLSLPQMGSTHVRDARLELYNREITYQGLNMVSMTGSYFGLISSKTEPTIAYTPNTNQEPITSHKDFVDFAGDKDAPLNGAKFDDDTGEFLGFFDPDVKDLFGVSAYLIPATLLSLTYWTDKVPKLGKRMQRKSSIPGFYRPEDVAEFLILDYPYRQVGNFYQVTELIMGSGENGFSTTLYP